MARKATPRPEWIAKTAGELALLLGVHERTVTGYKSQGIPQRDDGTFDAVAVLKWMRTDGPWRPKESSNKTELEAEKLQVDIDLARLKLERERGKLLDRAETLATVETMFNLVRARLDAIPDELGAALPPDLQADAVHDWKRKIQLVLGEMAQWTLPDDLA